MDTEKLLMCPELTESLVVSLVSGHIRKYIPHELIIIYYSSCKCDHQHLEVPFNHFQNKKFLGENFKHSCLLRSKIRIISTFLSFNALSSAEYHQHYHQHHQSQDRVWSLNRCVSDQLPPHISVGIHSSVACLEQSTPDSAHACQVRPQPMFSDLKAHLSQGYENVDSIGGITLVIDFNLGSSPSSYALDIMSVIQSHVHI